MKTTIKRQARLGKIEELLAARLTQQEIADRLGVSRTQIVNDCALLRRQRSEKNSSRQILNKVEEPVELPDILDEDALAQKTMEAMYKLLDKIGRGDETAARIYSLMWGQNN